MRRLVPTPRRRRPASPPLSAACATPAAAVPTTTLNPAKLPRGADVSIPHLERKTIVDGAVRVTGQGADRPAARQVRDGVRRRHGEPRRQRRTAVSSASRRTATSRATRPRERLRTCCPVTARPCRLDQESAIEEHGDRPVATTGALVARARSRVHVRPRRRRGRSWSAARREDLARGHQHRHGRGRQRAGRRYAGDLSADVFASYTKDPYDGGCTVVTPGHHRRSGSGSRARSGSRPSTPTASRIATVDILSDGIGPRPGRRAHDRRREARRLPRCTTAGSARSSSRPPRRCCSRPTAPARPRPCAAPATACERASDLHAG